MTVYKHCWRCHAETMQVNQTTSATGAYCTSCGCWNEHTWVRPTPPAAPTNEGER